MNLQEVLKKHSIDENELKKDNLLLNNLEKDLDLIDVNYKDNLFDKLLSKSEKSFENLVNHKNQDNTNSIKERMIQKLKIQNIFSSDQNEDQNSESDEENLTSGCPVVNNIKKDPKNILNFEYYHYIPFTGHNDYFFNFMGKLEPVEFRNKTKTLRNYPRHLKNTLFIKDERIDKIRKREFTLVFFIYDEIKDKANKLYKQKKYKTAIVYYTFAYSIIKWLEFKDKDNKKENEKSKELNGQSNNTIKPILDDDIILKTLNISDDFELGSSKTCLCYILKCLGYCYMHLRDYHEAIKCLNEAESILGEKIPDIYFRRSQARLFNKDATYQDLTFALKDINKAISNIKHEYQRDDFLKHFELVKSKIEEKKEELISQINSILLKAKYSCDKIKEKKLKDDLLFFAFSDGVMEKRNYKILVEIKEMYLYSIKYNYETKNENQLNIGFKEYNSFLDEFNKFEFFYKFEIKEKKLIEHLNLNIVQFEEYFKTSIFNKYIDEYRFKECEEIFSKIKFNNDLINYALEKVLEDERIENIYLNDRNYDDSSRIFVVCDYIKNKFKFYFKDTKNIFIFISGFFMLFLIIIVSLFTYTRKRKLNFPFKNINM